MSLEVEWPIARPQQTARRAAFLAHLLAGETTYRAALEVGVPFKTAKLWRAELRVSGAFSPPVPEIGPLVERILLAKLALSLSLAEAADDIDYLRAQPLEGLARLDVANTDALARLAELLQQVARDGAAGPGDDVGRPAETGPAPGGD